MNKEQVCKLDSSNVAYEDILIMLKSGAQIEDIKKHCEIMLDSIQKQKKILSNERETDRKHEQNEKLYSSCKYGTLLKSEFPCNICNKP